MVVLEELQDFAGGTSIHGFGYLVSTKSTSRTKIVWAVSIFVAMLYATLEMRNSVMGKCLYVFPTTKLKPMLIDKYVLITFLELESPFFNLQYNDNNLFIMTFIPEPAPSSIFPLASFFSYSCQLRPNFHGRGCFSFTRILFAPYKIFGTRVHIFSYQNLNSKNVFPFQNYSC